jgi:hypothetical protein
LQYVFLLNIGDQEQAIGGDWEKCIGKPVKQVKLNLAGVSTSDADKEIAWRF